MAPRLGIGVKVVKVFKLWPKNFVGIDFLGKNFLGMYMVYNFCVYPVFFCGPMFLVGGVFPTHL